MMSDFLKDKPVVEDAASLAGLIARRLQKIYGKSFNEATVNRILAMVDKIYPSWPEWNERDVILITYANSIVSDDEIPLKTLHRFLKEHLSTHISAVHILPFFPFTSDDGFAVSDYLSVNPAFGTWDDVRAIAADFYIMADLVINHVSSAHLWFKNYLENRTPGKGYFIEQIKGQDYSMVARPRSSALFTKFQTSEGEKDVWTTFSSDQIDLNFSNQEVLLEMIRIMLLYIQYGVRFIRLDAIAYLWKSGLTSCLHLEQTHEIVRLLRDISSYYRPGTTIITETNVPNLENWSYFGKGDEAHMVYQFSLPPLLLYGVFFQNAEHLTSWAKQIPKVADDQTFLNYTASHDGIGLRPLEGLVSESGINELIEGMSGFGGMISTKMNRDGSLGPYEINISWFDAMKGTLEGQDEYHEQRLITSQAIMMSLKGIPAIYFHNLLATPNDYRGVEKTGRARSINRSIISENELKISLSGNSIKSTIFHELLKLISIRKSLDAFHPRSEQRIIEADSSVFAFERYNEVSHQRVFCLSNLSKQRVSLSLDELMKKSSGINNNPELLDLISDEKISSAVVLKPCQTRWISVFISHILQ